MYYYLEGCTSNGDRPNKFVNSLSHLGHRPIITVRYMIPLILLHNVATLLVK